jgi:putative copper resistance protein D
MKRTRAGAVWALPVFIRLLEGEAFLMLAALMAAAVLAHSIPAATG